MLIPFLSDAYSQDIHEHDDIFNQIKAQLNITEEQNENFELIINEYLQKQTNIFKKYNICLLYTSPSPRDKRQSRMPSSA